MISSFVAASYFLFLLNQFASCDLCGQDRIKLADWFIRHGSPSLLEEPIPDYVAPVEENPYDNPDYPPADPNPGGVCGMKWSEKTDSFSGHKKYWLKNFLSESECDDAGFEVTHAGHCAHAQDFRTLAYISAEI